MIQNLLLISMIILCVLLIISIIKNPFDDNTKNTCRFKIQSPKYILECYRKTAIFNITVEKKHKYFINFPLSFKFYSHDKFKTFVKIKYKIPGEEQILLEKIIEFTSKVTEHIVYITDIIVGKITIEIILDVINEKPIICFEILQNNTCNLTKEHKLELIFP